MQCSESLQFKPERRNNLIFYFKEQGRAFPCLRLVTVGFALLKPRWEAGPARLWRPPWGYNRPSRGNISRIIMVSEEGEKASHSSPASEKERAWLPFIPESSEHGSLPSRKGGRCSTSSEKSPTSVFYYSFTSGTSDLTSDLWAHLHAKNPEKSLNWGLIQDTCWIVCKLIML